MSSRSPKLDAENGVDLMDDYWDEEFFDFAHPGGNSALRAASKSNPRNLPCPTCHWPDRLTPKDVQLGYQCDRCADASERGTEINYYEEDD